MKSSHIFNFSARTILVLIIFLLYSAVLHAQGQNSSTWYDYGKLAEALNLQPGHRLADIGTNDGFYLNHFYPILGDSGHIFAVDINTRGFDRLHENMNRWGYYNITPVYSMENNPLLPDGLLDAILIRNAYHEFSDTRQMIRHLKRALKPGGRLVISDPMHEKYREQTRQSQEKEHVLDIRFAVEDLEEAGFRIIRTVPDFAREPSQGLYYWLLIATPSE